MDWDVPESGYFADSFGRGEGLAFPPANAILADLHIILDSVPGVLIVLWWQLCGRLPTLTFKSNQVSCFGALRRGNKLARAHIFGLTHEDHAMRREATKFLGFQVAEDDNVLTQHALDSNLLLNARSYLSDLTIANVVFHTDKLLTVRMIPAFDNLSHTDIHLSDVRDDRCGRSLGFLRLLLLFLLLFLLWLFFFLFFGCGSGS